MRYRRPETDGIDPVPSEDVLKNPDDPGRSLVAATYRTRAARAARGSLPAAVTGEGRVCGTSASSEPRVTTDSTPRSCAIPYTISEKARQRRFGSTPIRRTTSRSSPGHASVEECVLGPGELARLAVDERDLRARGLEVEELLRIDLGEARGIPGAGEIAGGESRSLAAVVPALEGDNEDGPAEFRLGDESERAHFDSLRTRARTPPVGPARASAQRKSTARKNSRVYPHPAALLVAAARVARTHARERAGNRRCQRATTGARHLALTPPRLPLATSACVRRRCPLLPLSKRAPSDPP